IATAIVEFVNSRRIRIDEMAIVENEEGRGVTAKFHGIPYSIGSIGWLSEKARLPASWVSQIDEARKQGTTMIGVVEDTEFIGLIALNDRIREDSAHAIQLIHSERIYSVMITGDHKETAVAVAEKVGVEAVYAQVKPEEKAMIVSGLQEKGRKVAMVG